MLIFFETSSTSLAQIDLTEVNYYDADKFGKHLDQKVHDILSRLQEDWQIQIKVENRYPTYLDMLLRGGTTWVRTRTIPNDVCQLTTLKELVIRIGWRSSIIEGIPENIGNLVNLEKLEIKDTDMITKFPHSMVNMRNLRSINLEGTTVIANIPRSWLWRRNGPEERKARIIQNAWRGKELKEGADDKYYGKITGPLRFKDSKINIWLRVDIVGDPIDYVGSILDMSKEALRTPYDTWVPNNKISGGGTWIRKAQWVLPDYDNWCQTVPEFDNLNNLRKSEYM